MHGTPLKSVLSKIFSAIFKSRADDDYFFQVILIFHEVSKILFAFGTSFLKGHKQDPKIKAILEQFLNIFQIFQEPLAS